MTTEQLGYGGLEWPLTPEQREQTVQALLSIVTGDGSAKDRTAAAAALGKLAQQNSPKSGAQHVHLHQGNVTNLTLEERRASVLQRIERLRRLSTNSI